MHPEITKQCNFAKFKGFVADFPPVPNFFHFPSPLHHISRLLQLCLADENHQAPKDQVYTLSHAPSNAFL
jgi:hypothetical protein